MKKTLIYILILGLVGFGVWFVMFRDDRMFSDKDAGFTIKDTASIGKIFLATNDNSTIKLERTPKGWMVNDKYRVRQASLDQLLQALQFQVPQTPVSDQMHNNVVKSLKQGNIKVEVYSRSGEKMRVFYVGGETNSGSGTFMLMEGGSRPFIVQIPGFNGYLTPRYMPDLQIWRDRTVFQIGADDITRVNVTYPTQVINNFTIDQKGRTLSVTIDPALTQGKTLNRKRAQDYLEFFKQAYAEAVLNGLPDVRQNIASVPMIGTIEVTGRNGYQQKATFYATPLSRRSKNVLPEGGSTEGVYDIDHLYAVTNNNQDTFMVQRGIFDKFFRMGYEFYAQDQPVQDIAAPQVH